MRKRFYGFSLLGYFLLFSVFSAGIARAESRDTVKIGLSYDPQTVNILEFKIYNDLPVILNMHEALMSTNPLTGKRIKLLAKSIRVVNGKDLKIRLHKFAKFHTGDPVTAHDVKFTYEQCMNPKNRNIMAGRIGIESIKVLDDHNLIFRYYEPDAGWEEIMWIGICSKKYYEKVGKVKFSKHPVGSGPLRFVDRTIGHSTTLEVVPDHHGKRYRFRWYKPVSFKRLQFVTVTDDISRLAMLETGELDLIYDILPHQLKRLRQNRHIKIKRATNIPSLYGVSGRMYNFEILRDMKLFTAMGYAINRQELVDKIFLGEGYPLYMMASRSELGYDPRYKIPFDPAKARRLIKQSNYKPGTPLILTYTSALPNAALIAQALQKYFQDVGLTIKLQQLEAGVQATYNRTKDKREGHLVLYTWAGGRDPSTRLKLIIPSTSIYTGWGSRPSQKLLDKLVAAQGREMNRRKRLAIINRIHRILRKEPSGLYLFGLNMIYAMRDRIDYTWTPGEAGPFWTSRIQIVK
jgi:peptide/nickel transport system substrate-binding protein